MSTEKRGRFIVLDGLGKSGKSSAIRYLQERLPPESTVFTREPGGTPFAEGVREILLRGKVKLSPRTHVLTFFATRSAHIEEKIVPALEEGKNVICDRFDSTTDAFNLCGEEAEHLRFLFKVLRDEVVSKNAEPDLYIIFDVDPRVAYERHQATKASTEKDKFDDKPVEFYERARKGFLDFSKQQKSIIIDANRPIEVVSENVYQVVLDALV